MAHLPLIIFLVCFVLMFLLRMPTPAGMIVSCVMYFLTDGLVKGCSFLGMLMGTEGQLHLVAQKSIEAIFTNTTIIAVPLFIFAANVMNAGKITEYVFGVCKGLVGRFPGGLAHVNILASLVFSGMTGSAVADASGLGKMEIDAMRAEGYDDGFSCGITAAGAIAGFYSLIIAILAYKILDWKGLKQVLVDTVRGTGSVSIMIGAASAISFIFAKEQIGVRLGNWIMGFTDSKVVFLLMVNVIILVLGMFVDTSVIQLVMIPILWPVAEAFGVNIIHFGLIIIFNMMLGLSTPPFGMCLFITSGISGTPLKDVIREIWWPTVVMLIVLLIITFIPQSVLFLPQLFHMM